MAGSIRRRPKMAQTNSSLTKMREDFFRIREMAAAEAQIGVLHAIGQRLKDWPEFCELELQEQDESIKFLLQVADSSSPDPADVKQKAREVIFLYLIPLAFCSRNQLFSERIDLILDFLGNPEHILFSQPFHKNLLSFLHTSYRLSQNLETSPIYPALNGLEAKPFRDRVGKISQALVNARDYDYLETNIILEAIPALQKFSLGQTIPPTLPFGELSKFFEKNIVPEHRLALKTLCMLQGHKPALENTSLGKITVTMPSTNATPTVYTFVPAPANVKKGFDYFARLFLPYVVWYAKFQSAAREEIVAVESHTKDDRLDFSFWASKSVKINPNQKRQDPCGYVIIKSSLYITYNFTTRTSK